MCGICGIFRPDGKAVDPTRVERMREVMSYRGPNGSGLTQGPGFALGHRRLSIIDLSESGLQPMSNEDGSVQVVFNGAIYNFPDLRRELESAGHRFKSRTDTEILAHGYEQWGFRELLRRIRGMYAFAIVDSKRQTLHLARDPVGKKPLFFRLHHGELAFASSARALAGGLDTTPDVDPVAIDQLLSNLYISGPRTIFRGVEKLLPGHALTLNADGTREDFSHWRPNFLGSKTSCTEGEWLERIEEALEQAVRRRLIADVPIGILLSGGVDSSLVTSIAKKVAGEIRTFSVASEDPALDESRFAQAVAERCGTIHHVLHVRGDVRNNLVRMAAAMGEPLADASAANVFAIAEQAVSFVTVLLTGDGGDEAFGGYTFNLAYYISGQLRPFLGGALRAPTALLAHLLEKGSGAVHRAGTIMRLASAPVEQTLFATNSALDADARDALYSDEFKAEIGSTNRLAPFLAALPRNGHSHGLDADKVMQAHMVTYLPDDFLAKVDSGTMGVSIEARSPFLDVDVLELAMAIPASERFRRYTPKYLLRRLALKHLPSECVQRRKQGFVAPVGRWLRRDWPDLVDELLLGPELEKRGWFRRQGLENIVSKQRRGLQGDYLVWALVVLELWARMAIDRSLQPSDVV